MRLFATAGMLLALLASLGLLAPHQATAEILRTKGTFRGIYHENRAGVGHFHFFIVPKELRKHLAEFDGKYIELEVLAGRQPINPGPAIIEKIGKIKVLPAPPFLVDIKTIVPGVHGPDTFDILYSFKNVAKQPMVLDARDVAIGIGRFEEIDHPDEIDSFFGTGYRRKQLAYRGRAIQEWNFISPLSPGQRTHFFTHHISLQPGESVPFIWHGLSNRKEKQEGDFEVSARHHDAAIKGYIPIAAWKRLDLPLPMNAPPGAGLKIAAKVTRDAEWLTVEGRLKNNSGKPSHIFARMDGDLAFLPGLIELLDRKGKALTPYLDWYDPGESWVRRPIDAAGIPFRFRISHARMFSTAEEGSIVLWTPTDAGMEKLVVAGDLPVRDARPLPEWGKPEQGYRCRIQLPKDQWQAEKEIRVFVQAESNRKDPDVLFINSDNFRSHVVLEIDGKQAAISSTGLTWGLAYQFPFERGITLSGQKLAPGKHTLKLTVKSDAGIYESKNTRTNEITRWRQLDATLISNEVVFEIKK